MVFTVPQRLQDLKEIVKSNNIVQSNNRPTCFLSAVAQSKCIKIISASDKKNEMNTPIDDVYHLSSVKLRKSSNV